MPDWLNKAVALPDLTLATVAIQLSIALLAGFVVALLARFGRREGPAVDTFPITLVMLCVLIALVTQVVGDNAARAFSLVGALSIVRFRTVVRDTQDTAFVMLAVVTGMGIGSGHLFATAIGMGVVAVAVGVARFTPLLIVVPLIESQISIRVNVNTAPEQLFGPLFHEDLERFTLASAETAKQGTMLDLTYRVLLRPGVTPVAFLTALHKLPGVESVEWHERAGDR
jgi:hypothetical protein